MVQALPAKQGSALSRCRVLVLVKNVDAVAARVPRVSLVLKADIRPGVTGALTAKVEAVEHYLQA